LQDIFNLLISTILPALSDPSSAYNQQHLYVLTSLSQVKSVVLLTDIPSSEPLLVNLFVSFFDILAGSAKFLTGEQLGKNVELNMTSILVTLVDESANLPSEVVDVIVAQFLRTDPRATSGPNSKSRKNAAVFDEKQSTLVMKELPPAYNMAKTICNECPEKMARYMSQYFNDVIVDASSTSTAKAQLKKTSHRKVSDDLNDSDTDVPSGPTEDDLKELRKVHQLLRELWRASPAVLQNVVPQLEAELSAENVHLRTLATETFGDIVSGIGAAGLPPPPTLDPAAYPPISLSESPDSALNQNVLTKPCSPTPFPQAHPQAYSSFLARSHDKSPLIRAAWTTGIGRILTTSAGGVGLGQQEEDRLINDLARMLQDADERVRITAVKVVGNCSFRDVILKLGSSGGLDKPGSVLAILSERIRDRKHTVRTEAMTVLARLWGVGAGAIAAEEEQVTSIIGAAPSKILDTSYIHDLEIDILLDHVLYEQLLPLSYPPIKAKNTKLTNGNAQIAKENQTNGKTGPENIDPDKIRTERLLLLVKNLDERAKKVFFGLQARQLQLSKYMTAYLRCCEDYNGGVVDEDEKVIKEHVKRLIDTFAKQFPDTSKAADSLWKFAKMHDRRSYQLIRFCMAPESDYRTVVKAIKEFAKRIEQNAPSPQELLNTLLPFVYRVSILVYNKSHVPAIMDYSRTDEKSLAATAHELLREISTRIPEVLKAHVQEICLSLQDDAPNVKKTNDPGAVDNLKACASFASRFAKEMPQDRKFVQAMTNFALYGAPAEAAKHAVTIIMTVSDKKEMLAKELLQKCIKQFQYGGEGFLSRLATLSQLMLLAPNEVDQEKDAVSDIAIQEILIQVRTSRPESLESYTWSPTVDPECEAKCWALKILVNRIRSHADLATLSEIADPVYKVLLNLITNEGELSPNKNTPPSHKPRLRLLAACLCLKLCTKKNADALFTPTAFNALALVAQDSILQVRARFIQRLKKYLGGQKLPQRFYTIPFLLAFEPSTSLKSDTTTWVRNRASQFYALKAQQSTSKANVVMESVFARLLSLLAHHPDYGASAEDLIDFARYMLFYLNPVATEENLSLIYHIAQRVKQSRDAIGSSTEYDDHLYHLSDLAQLAIRKFEDAHNWSIQTLPAKIRLPTSLFTEVKDHEEAQQIAERNFLPEGVEEGVEGLVKATMKAARSQGKKRRSEANEDADDRSSKKRAKSLPIRNRPANEKKAKAAPRAKAAKKSKSKSKSREEVPSSERRRSGRANVTGGQYAERDDEEDDEEMAEGVAAWEYEGGVVVKEDGDEEDLSGDVKDASDQEPEEGGSEPEETKSPRPKPSPKGKKPVTALKAGKRSATKGR